MSDLTSGRAEPCKDSQGGLKRIYVFKHVQYPIQSLQGLKSGILTQHPTTLIFEYQGRQKQVNERLDNMAYDQDCRIVLPIIGSDTNQSVLELLKNRVGLIAEDRNGQLRVYGIQNGMDVDARLVSGNAKEDLNGYQIDFTGKEEYAAPFLSDLATVGFFTEGLTFGCLLSSSGRPSSIADLVSSCNVLQSS